MEKLRTGEAAPQVEVIFDRTVADEVNRVRYLCRKSAWYKENGYKPTYPKAIQEKLERSEDITEENIRKSVEEEFDSVVSEEKVSQTKEEWGRIQEGFFKNLKTLGLPIQKEYRISITVYGTGGSYGPPNNVQLNNHANRQPFVIAHEVVHLTIEHLIQKYKIDHWTKERMVDLVMNKFFPENQKLQRNPEHAEQIGEIFEREFPNIEKVISEIAKL